MNWVFSAVSDGSLHFFLVFTQHANTKSLVSDGSLHFFLVLHKQLPLTIVYFLLFRGVFGFFPTFRHNKILMRIEASYGVFSTGNGGSKILRCAGKNGYPCNQFLMQFILNTVGPSAKRSVIERRSGNLMEK